MLVDNIFVVGNMWAVALDNTVFVVGKSFDGCIGAVVLMLDTPVVYKLGPDLILEGMKLLDMMAAIYCWCQVFELSSYGCLLD